MTAKIRRAEPGDAEAIIELINGLGVFVDEPPTQITAEEIRRDGFGPDAWFDCFIAEWDGRPVGYALAYFGFTTEHGGRGLHLSDLYVDGDQRGRGLGKALMAAVARHALARGALWMVWDVWVENHSARAFYTTLGAVPCDEVRAMALKGDPLAALAREA